MALALVSSTPKVTTIARLAMRVFLLKTTTVSLTRVLPWGSVGLQINNLSRPNAILILTTRTTVPTSPLPSTKK